MTSPDPVPLPALPLAAIVTTEGTTWSATEVTGHALTVVEDVEALSVEPEDCVAPTMTPPTTPPTTSAIPAAAQGSHRRELRTCFVSVMLAPVPRRGQRQPDHDASVRLEVNRI